MKPTLYVLSPAHSRVSVHESELLRIRQLINASLYSAQVPTTSLGYPMSEEGRAAFESLRLIRNRARGVGRWRDDVKIALGEERVSGLYSALSSRYISDMR
jgi:hypothetical protein